MKIRPIRTTTDYRVALRKRNGCETPSPARRQAAADAADDRALSKLLQIAPDILVQNYKTRSETLPPPFPGRG